jgi:hypothetical protein
MRTLIVLLSLLVSFSANAKIRAYFSNVEVLEHVLSSDEFKAAAESQGGVGELYNVEIEKTGESVNSKYLVRLSFLRSSIGHGGSAKQTPCLLKADVSIEIKKRGRPAITFSELSAPVLSEPVCAI